MYTRTYAQNTFLLGMLQSTVALSRDEPSQDWDAFALVSYIRMLNR